MIGLILQITKERYLDLIYYRYIICFIFSLFYCYYIKYFFKISPTSERVNIDKLKVKEKILFYEEVMLFEDELADNGTAQLSVKIVSIIHPPV